MYGKSMAVGVILASLIFSSSAPAQGLLGGVLDSVESGVSGVSGALAGAGLPDVGGVLGQAGLPDVGGVLDTASSLVPAIADLNVDLGDLNAGISVGGPNLLDVDISLGGGGGGGGSNGNNGTNGQNGQNGTGGGGGGGGSSHVVIPRGGPAFGSTSTACANTNPNQLISLFQQSKLSGWNRASNIQLVPLRVCREVRNQIGSWLAANPQYHSLVGAVARDNLINAALSRTQYQPGHVLGVQQQGQTLMVYVF